MRRLKDSIVVTSVKNEGPFLLEWIAWYRMLGFERILVIFNDCTDHSPQLLRLLGREGVLEQRKHTPDPEAPPQPQNHYRAFEEDYYRQAAWAFVADVDEYLLIHTGDGSAAALAEAIDGHAMGMAINWRIFGTSSAKLWRDRFIHRRFLRSGNITTQQNSCYKTFYKRPDAFGPIRAHGPKGWWLEDEEPWGEDDRIFILADGTPYPEYHPRLTPINEVPKARMTNKLAQVNHYALQTREQFVFKRGRKSAAAHIDRYTDEFFERFDRNKLPNKKALKHDEDFFAEYKRLARIRGVLRLHHLCCADMIKDMRSKRGSKAWTDPRYVYHIAMGHLLPVHKKDHRQKRPARGVLTWLSLALRR